MHGTLWSLAGAGASRALTLVASIVAARLLNRERFGEFGMIQTTVSMFGQYAGFGLSLTATKHIAELRRSEPGRCGRILSLTLLSGLAAGALVAGAMAALAPVIARYAFNAPHLAGALAVAGVLLFFSSQSGVILGVLSGFEDFRSLARIEFLQSLACLLAVFPLVVWRGVSGAILAVSLGQALSCFWALAVARRRAREAAIPWSARGCWGERRVLWHFSMPGFLSGALLGPAYWLSSALVVNQPRGFSLLAGFNAANQWRTGILFVPAMMRRVSLPVLASLHGSGEYSRFKRTLFASLGINVGVALAVALPVVALSPWVMSAYGPLFRSDWDLLVTLAAIGVLEASLVVITQVTASLGKLWWELLANGVWAVAIVSGTAALAPTLGARGLVAALGVAVVLQACIHTYAAVRITRGLSRAQGRGAGVGVHGAC